MISEENVWYQDENGEIINLSQLRREWPEWLRQNELTEQELPFEWFVSNCLDINGGTLRLLPTREGRRI